MNNPTAWIWSGDEFAPCDSIPLTDRGFRYGMSVFESLPVRKNTPLFLPAHYERLRHACAQTGFVKVLPSLEDFDVLLRGISFDAFARIYVTAGDGSVSAQDAEGRVLVYAEPRTAREKYGDDAYKLVLHPAPVIPLLGGLKTANYWANLIALQKGRQRGCDESLLFNTNGDLVSACMANVFVVQEGRIKTPATDTGARAGVVREWVMRKRPVAQGRITPADLENAGEIFLTSSWLGVMPAASLEGRELPSREIADLLHIEYERDFH
ncbi:MAG TPA: aminotransferase class IV [Chthoniobacteraceae bacterium]|nr:aminotransferase class IV [Chthoniobacteraceae bacterium]